MTNFGQGGCDRAGGGRASGSREAPLTAARLLVAAFIFSAADPSAPLVAKSTEIKDRSPTVRFADCRGCPQMALVPAGVVELGSDESRKADARASGHKEVHVAAFAAGAHEVTFDEWDFCVRSGGCSGYRPDDHGWGRKNRPVVGVSWADAQAYVAWLTAATGRRYRLLTEAEWEYAAKAGARTPYWWGQAASHDYANYGSDNCCSGLAAGRDRWVNTAPVGSFPANSFGLHDINGNVAEWVEDCSTKSYDRTPDDGTAFIWPNCSERVHRGGGWLNMPSHIRSDIRPGDVETSRTPNLGFRVAASLERIGPHGSIDVIGPKSR